MEEFLKRHDDNIRGVISCFDRIIITGTFPDICHADAMTSLLYQKKIRIFDDTRWAVPLRDEIRQNAERLVQENGLEIEFVHSKKHF